MNGDIYSDMALEEATKTKFGQAVDISSIIVHDIEVGNTMKASVFLTTKKQLLCYLHGPSKLLLGDIQKIIARMGLKAELYFPPKGQPQYFDDIGRARFREVFPGHHQPTSEQIIYYRTLAPYNPALVQISEVKSGEIFCYDADSHTKWRVAAKFAYRRIKTS